MAHFHSSPDDHLDGHDMGPFNVSHTELGLTEMKVAIGKIQQRLKKLHRTMPKTGSGSPETADLIQSLETTLLLCQSTHKRLQESHRRIVSFTVTDTLPQIHKALQVVSGFTPVDMPHEEAQTNVCTALRLRPLGRPDPRPLGKALDARVHPLIINNSSD